jgi:hypothetical protein
MGVKRRTLNASMALFLERYKQMFRKFILPLVVMASAALPFASSGQAAIGDGVLAAHVQMTAPIEDASYVYGGHNYCWYDGGWKGAGWYQCGYAWRHGLGWGGAVGWTVGTEGLFGAAAPMLGTITGATGVATITAAFTTAATGVMEATTAGEAIMADTGAHTWATTAATVAAAVADAKS